MRRLSAGEERALFMIVRTWEMDGEYGVNGEVFVPRGGGVGACRRLQELKLAVPVWSEGFAGAGQSLGYRPTAKGRRVFAQTFMPAQPPDQTDGRDE